MSTTNVTLEVNGREERHFVEPRTSLADLLRGACALTGTHLGCEHGVCGACTVMLDGAPARSCITYAVQADGAAVRTIEGFDDEPVMHELREAFKRHHALQCGFCTPGMLITARDIVTRFERPTEERIREELGGNLCRCTGYVGIVAAILEVAASGKREAAAFPTAATAVAAAVPTESVPQSNQPAGEREMVRIAQALELPHPPARLWEALGDVERMARCLPGAEIVAVEGNAVRGRMRMRLGPIASSFEVDATQMRDDEQRRGRVAGQGRDKLTGSRARGVLDFAVAPSGAGSRLDVQLGFSLQGPLAHFSRGTLVQDLAQQLLRQFGANLSAHLEGHGAPAAGRELRASGMLLAALRRWLARLFGR